ncbi:MAG: hypothetical protein ABMA15_17595, partial [Vicinamibacterales bacterium]
MRVVTRVLATSTFPAFALAGFGAAGLVFALQVHGGAQASLARPLPAISPTPVPAVTTLASRLELERYKATIKGLTQFGDRRQGTERNRKAVDWIEAQLRSYGCPTERVKYAH